MNVTMFSRLFQGIHKIRLEFRKKKIKRKNVVHNCAQNNLFAMKLVFDVPQIPDVPDLEKKRKKQSVTCYHR